MRQLGAVRREGRVQGDAPALAQPADTWVHAVARHHGRALARVRSAKQYLFINESFTTQERVNFGDERTA